MSLIAGTKSAVRLTRAALARDGSVKGAFLHPCLADQMHPVFEGHANVLQPRTERPTHGGMCHAINRLPDIWRRAGCSYIAEVEALISVAPRSIAKMNVDNKAAQDFIHQEIDGGRLRRIVFQSDASRAVHDHFMTDRIREHSSVATLVPPEILRKPELPSGDGLSVLLIISRSFLKGTFLLPGLLAAAPSNLRLTVVCAEPIGIPELEADPRVETIIIPRLPIATKRDLFQSHHLFLNISQMDTLGSFLDSVRFNTPMVTVPGSHASSYVTHGETGWILPSPYYYYDPACGVAYNNKETFEDYLRAKDLSEWDGLISAVGKLLSSLSSEDIRRITEAQYEDTRERHSVDRWLNSIQRIYEEARK